VNSSFGGLVRLTGLAALCAAQTVLGQGAKNFPDKPVRVVVGYSPGGLPDTIAR
jgi:tripartite-type tricarboxylate transporter receptor subunit TctC